MNVYSKFTDMFKHNIKATYILRSIFLLLTLMTFGATNAWAQTSHPYEGIWYMKNRKDASNIYYVVPAKDPQITKANHVNEDAYFSSDYTKNAGDPEKPFITTYKTGDDVSAIWQFVPVSGEDNFYYIVHVATGKHMKFQTYLTGNNARRKFVHLEDIAKPGDTEKFEITAYDDGVKIKPKNNAMYLNIAGENQDRYNGGTSEPYYSGIIGGMSGVDKGSKFILADASSQVCATPTISYNESTGEVSIATTTDGATIYYTTDGTTPTTLSTQYIEPFSVSSEVTDMNIQAIAVKDGMFNSVVASKQVVKYTYIIVNSSGNIATQYTTPYPVVVGTPLSGYASIPDDIKSPFISDESITYKSFDGPFSKAALDAADPIEETPTTSNIYITYTTTNLSNKFLHLQGVRTFNIKNSSSQFVYDDGTDTSVDYDSSAEPTIADKRYVWYFTGLEAPDPYAVIVRNVGSKNYLTYTSSTLGLANSPQTYIIKDCVPLNSDPEHEDATGTITLQSTDGSIVFSVTPVKLPLSYTLIDKAGKLIESNITYTGTWGLPAGWQSPLATYKYYKAATIDGDTFTFSEDDRINGIEEAEDNVVYVTYDVKNNIDIQGSKTYLMAFSDGATDFYPEDGDNGVSESAIKAVYPYNNGDFNLYIYGATEWTNQLSNGASTRTRWLWYLVSNHNGTDLTGDDIDPYHVIIKSRQNQVYKVGDNSYDGSAYLYTYKPNDGVGIVTGVITQHDVVKTLSPELKPTEYMLLGTDVNHMMLKTVNEINGSRQTVNKFEQYWKNYPTAQTVAGVANPTADNATLTGKGWHRYQDWAYSEPWGGGTKTLEKGDHWFQTVSMGSGVFSLEEVALEPEVILLDQHGWEIARVPVSQTAKLKQYDSPMVETYHWYPKANKVSGYHKYTIPAEEAKQKIDVYEGSVVVRSVLYTSTSLSETPEGNVEGYAAQNSKYKTDFYVTYTVKSDYADTYQGAATEGSVKATSFFLKQAGKYAQNSNNVTIVLVDKPSLTGEIPTNVQWKVKPNFNIDHEMGYKYLGETGAQPGAKSKNATEQDYVDGVVSTWSNGFDPYNVQIQSVSNTARYFTTNTVSTALDHGIWTGTGSSTVSLREMSAGHISAEGPDHTTLDITNATFMVVDDGNGNMRLMPRFDNTKVMTSFTGLSEQQAAAPVNDDGNGTQSLVIELVPIVITSTDEILSMKGYYVLAENFTQTKSLGTSDAPFEGTIDGQLNHFDFTMPLVKYANNAIIRNIILNEVSLTEGNDEDHLGAIACTATGETRIYNCGVDGGSLNESAHVGGIVGHLDGNAHVVNCYSYANITGGAEKGGIVGYNNIASTAANLQTMVMNCAFYGDITGSGAPVYGGQNIANLNSGGLNTFNYYAYQKLPTDHISTYNSALAIDDKYLKRFEFYRLLLNSNKKLAAYYASTSTNPVQPGDMAKWVLETADRSIVSPKEYPVLKAQGYYPSVINYDVENAPTVTLDANGRPIEADRNKGGKLGKQLRVHLSGTGITTTLLTIDRTDKDFERYNYNYDKIQLPYFNDVGEGNYTDYKVVTGWEIVSMTGGTAGTYNPADVFGGYNFADRNCTNKDLFSQTGRVFSQGAYFDVPYGVTDIYIQPHWATAAYVADEYLDVVYNTSYGAQGVTQLGKQFPTGKITINGSEQTVYKSISDALKNKSSETVYDLAIVLVGNLHQGNVPSAGSVPFTVMSADLDHDNEPDYSMIYHHTGRTVISPIRFDFLNIPGTAQAQKPNGTNSIRNFTIFKTKGWFETTNTCLVYSNQVEYENKDGVGTKDLSPLILQGGDFEQFVSTQSQSVDGRTIYIHVGGNVHIQSFGLGTHSDGSKFTPHIPVSVTGGEYDGFYLSGTYNANADVRADDAECYISGGYFKEAAGASLEQIDGNVHWQIYNADIDAFFGGGINEAKPITGNVATDIYNSYVTLFCGGPKFGNMQGDKKVTTNAEGCVFGKFFGAGYGGTSIARKKYYDKDGTQNWTTLQGYYTNDKGKYFDGKTTGSSQTAGKDYGKKGLGVATDFEYEFFVWSTGATGARLFVDFASFSLAQCNDVNSKLKGCTINQDFYGGGSLGKVVGKATSELDGCTVLGNVFGGGYSASLPTIQVRDAGFTPGHNPSYNSNTGMFEPGVFSGTTPFTWKNAKEAGKTLTNNQSGSDLENHYVYTNADLTALGQVGETDLTVKGNTSVAGNVFGGGDESAISASATATGNTKVTIEKNDNNETPTVSYVYGGGNTADVDGSTEVDMTNGTVSQDIYGGGKGQTTVVGGNVEVNIGPKGNAEKPLSVHNVYGGSAFGAVNTTQNTETGKYDKTTTVNINGGTVTGSVFGGGLGQEAAEAVAGSGTPGDPGYIAPQEAKPAIVAKNFGATTVNMEGGQVKTAVYGGANVNGVLKGGANVNVQGGTVRTNPAPAPTSASDVKNAVFGGGYGELTIVEGDVTVTIGTQATTPDNSKPTVYGNVYGGSALGKVQVSEDTGDDQLDKKIDVNLYGGTIYGNVFGGGLGRKASAEPAVEAKVGGDVNVLLDGAKFDCIYAGEGVNRIPVTGQIFGANNLNGTPKGRVLVHVKRTVDSAKPTVDGESKPIGREGRTTYDVAAVYGGGNQADYVPTKATGTPAEQEEAFAKVIIEGCELTSIDKVYGGGNAAAVPATDVTVKGSYIINTLYGGGNGAGEGNLGANVGYRSYSSLTPTEEEKTSKQYGTGKAETKLLGGYINTVYGGSNTRGDVRGGTDVRTKTKGEVVDGDCCAELNVGDIYGAGSHADTSGDVNITLDCMPEDYVDQVFGGAELATVNGNVTLTVTSGKFGRVFGGNNEGGNIRGSITVNVSEDGCKPLIIGELFGGGNNAPYSIYGCTEGAPWTANVDGEPYFDPEKVSEDRVDVGVYVYSCTSIGRVFGGGQGESAKVIGNTRVYVNMMKGIVNDVVQDNLGKIGQVFGGGKAADVIGNTRVDIGTAQVTDSRTHDEEGVKIEPGTYLKPQHNAEDIVISAAEAGVYGGGLSADVNGDATLNIGTVEQDLGTTIIGNIFGGGYGETTTVTGDVVVNIGKRTNTATEGDPVYAYEGYANITGDVYGGSAKGKVNATKDGSTFSATIKDEKPKTTSVNFYGGAITGNIYGGGLGVYSDDGNDTNDFAADVYGPVTVTLEKGSATNTVVNTIFGCNNVLGTPKNTVTVDINGGTVNNSVYGGGNQAAYTPTESTSNYPAVNIINGTVHENVFGGGLGLSAVVTANPHITIGDNVEGHVVAIKKSVYGGGELAGVTGNTDIVLNSGTIGTEGEGTAIYGNIYGGGFGNTESTTAGLVSGNTNMTINGGAVLHNLYGGGAYGSVGTYTYNSETHETTCAEGTGTANITVTGGTIGTNGHENGMVFGASRGDVAAPDGVHDRLAWVNNTNVIIGTSGEGHGTDAPEPQIKGSVYGGGENGHTYHDTHVTINSGRVGITDINIDGGAAYAYRGNVYGGGCGTDKYDSGSGDKYNPLSGIVNGETHVVINGGHVVRNLYGAGAMGSAIVGTNVTINGGTIGAEGSGGGYVYAAARGDEALTDANQAYVGNTSLTIAGGTVWGSAFGGGQSGIVKGNVDVAVSGGVVKNDVYGGGALANTNTDNWNANKDVTTYDEVTFLKVGESVVTGLYTKPASEYVKVTAENAKAENGVIYYRQIKGGWADDETTSTTNTTTVTLTGGVIGNAYGGGLGDVSTPVYVFGDVTLSVNDPAKLGSSKGIGFTREIAENVVVAGKKYSSVPITGSVFGCNNINGTPRGEVTVTVYSTRQLDESGNVIPNTGPSSHSPNATNEYYEIQAVYGGGNQASYQPVTGKNTHVIIYGCDESSIEKVYGGGNSAAVPQTDVTIWGSFDINSAFGGGNGSLPIKRDGVWIENAGSEVYGNTNISCKGGKIGNVFGGSDAKGNVHGTMNTDVEHPEGGCALKITKIYGASKEADVDADVNVIISGCSSDEIEYVCGGSYNANIRGDITLTITSGFLKNVYGGNDARGSIGGNITVNIQEEDPCKPVIIQNLVGGGFAADYPGINFKTGENAKRIKRDSNGKYIKVGDIYEYEDFTEGKITVNVKSATRIDNVFGGGFRANVNGDTEVNVNMVKGLWAGAQAPAGYTDLPNVHKGHYAKVLGLTVGTSSVEGFYEKDGDVYTVTSDVTAASGKNYYSYSAEEIYVIDDAIGTIGNVYGGGSEGVIYGNSIVNIGSSTTVPVMHRGDDGTFVTTTDVNDVLVIDYIDSPALGAHITGNVFGGGSREDVTGNSEVYICANKTGEGTYAPVAEGAEKVTISNGSVYGGGSVADVHGNTSVTMDGGYVYDGVYGGGLHGSVGTVATRALPAGHPSHAGCVLGKPETFAEGTGKCKVVISGGQVGPVEVATQGMQKDGGPVDVGFVFGAGRGEVEDPATDPDADFHCYVKETEVIIRNGYESGYEDGAADSLSHVTSKPLIMASVYGGGENGRVRGNTLVKIYGGQIGCGEGEYNVDGSGIPTTGRAYTETQWETAASAVASGNAASIDAAALAECAAWQYKSPYLPYDPFSGQAIGDDVGSGEHNESGIKGTDGHTYYGSVFGGGSGYYPYKRADGHHDWLRSAGMVEGNTRVYISGGHILTNVYGGNETTDVLGKCTVKMSGGTIGVPRTLAQIAAHPVTCYLFGAGKGDQRTHFNTWTNVQETEVEVSGGIIFGSVFGGGEDGHILGNATVNIREGARIGTWGTSYVDGNVFGGGRGFSGDALTAGTVGGNTDVNIDGGQMLGSVYGGGRMASVGLFFTSPTNDNYAQLQDGAAYGHITIDISGGTIGKAGVTGDGAEHSGNVFGGSMGRLTLLDNTTINPLWPELAQVKGTNINITGGTITRNVYGGGEYGTVREDAAVTVSGGTVSGNVFGGGYGSDDYEHATPIAVKWNNTTMHYVYTPMQWAGMVGGNTTVSVSGGTVGHNVYGGGELASVGIIDCSATENPSGDITAIDGKTYAYNTIVKHTDLTNSFALSWPYQFKYVPNKPNSEEKGGKATVTITGGHVGTALQEDVQGYVYGGGMGKPMKRYIEAFCANVRETEVNIHYSTTPALGSPDIFGAVYGGGENGHVYEDTKVDITGGLIGMSVYAGGKGKDKYHVEVADEQLKDFKTDAYIAGDIYSITAGKVYGNTRLTMSGGHVTRSVYGGGFMASVGKGNYAGGDDDYSKFGDKCGYGEAIEGNLWDGVSANSQAFLGSGKASITITGGTIGTADGVYGDLPTGNVVGGSRGEAAPNVFNQPVHLYNPTFHVGNINEAEIIIGTEDQPTNPETAGQSGQAPRIYASVYGGGQDGHMRRDAKITIYSGEIGKAYTSGDQNDLQWQQRGNVFGSGSGIGKYRFDYQDGKGEVEGLSFLAGCVARFSEVDIQGGIIHRNVYGGGSVAGTGMPKFYGQNYEPYKKGDNVQGKQSMNIVNVSGGVIGQEGYGGNVFGASRGEAELVAVENPMFATAIWTEVNIKPNATNSVNDPVIWGNVYGGGELGSVKKDTKVSLTGGEIKHNAYGGGKGIKADVGAVEANIGGNTTVELNRGVASSAKGCIVSKVFGCNDQNGTPKGHALVHVYATQHKNQPNIGSKYAKFESMEGGYSITNYSGLTTLAEATGTDVSAYTAVLISGEGTEDEKKTALANMIEAIADKKYDVLGVYGGGDLAMYEPTDPNENTDVIIDGCALTSIKQVYGGGNAASTPANLVRINEAYEIHEAFGGGNGKDDYETGGKWYRNLGANVGYKATFHSDKSGDPTTGTKANPYPAVENDDANTPEERRANTSYHYGKGTVELNVTGGYVHTTYGGSNMKGNVRKSAITNTEDAGVCTLQIDVSYPAGKNADTDGEAKINGSCVDYLEAIYGGSENANVYSDVVIDITNGHYGAIYGGNNTRGKIYGSITINVHEEGCKPIIIDNLYGGGYNADYSIYGYNDDGSARTKTQYDALDASEKAKITVQRDPQINIISATRIGKIYGGGYNAKMIGSPSVNVNMEEGFVTAKYVTKDPDDFEEGYHHVIDHDVDCSYYVEKLEDGKAILRRGTVGTVYGGGYKGDVQGDTDVEIGTGEWLSFTGKRETTDADGKIYTYNSETGKWDWTKTEGGTTTSGTVDDKPVPARNAATITGNVFGGGEGEVKESGTDAFLCESAMVGVNEDNYPDGATSVVIANGTVGTLEGAVGSQTLKAGTGNVYGGGEMGRVQKDATVTIGVTPKEGETKDNTKFKPNIYGSVFGAGKGVYTHGFSGLVQGNSSVTVQGFAKVGESVYGGGENASVGRYNLDGGGRPTTPVSGGKCTVTVVDNAEIGPDNMAMTKAGGPDNTGHVFGAGMGVIPYEGVDGKPWSINMGGGKVEYTTDETYLSYLETLALAAETEVTIGGKAFVKGDVFGGSENGRVQANTWVKIQDDCQIGAGFDKSTSKSLPKYDVAKFINPLTTPVTEENALAECASWPYEYPYSTYDKFANAEGDLDKYPDGTSTEGGRRVASDGHTFYGNVFGGGSGFFPYKAGKWHWNAGYVGGNTTVDITGGHILTNVYGGNEMTNVVGKCTINMSGGTIGVPRTLEQIVAHPVTCYLYGGGMGDPRIFFNKKTNVGHVNVNISGGIIYGSVFGGGEDGHVLGDVTTNIQNTVDNTDPENPLITSSPKIGTWGTSYVDGNVFGGGRGFGGEAYTAGNVAGSVTMNIKGGTMLGSVYGGGRLGSVGYGLYDKGAVGYGEMMADNATEEGFAPPGGFSNGRGHVEISISGDNTVIGNKYEFTGVPTDVSDLAAWQTAHHVPQTTYETTSKTVGDVTTYTHRLLHTRGGNVYGGGMGRDKKLDGSSLITAVDWYKLGNAKSTKLTVTGNPWIMGNIYGGGEFGAVRPSEATEDRAGTTTINITGGTIGTEITTSAPEKDNSSDVQYTYGSVFGGGTGTYDYVNATSPVAEANKLAAYVTKDATVTVTDAIVRASVYGGGELSAVGGDTYVTISGTTKIGRNEVWATDSDNPGYVKFGSWRMGNVYGGGRGHETAAIAGVVKGNTNVIIQNSVADAAYAAAHDGVSEGDILGSPEVYHNVYGGGSLGSVGTFFVSGAVPSDGGTPQGPMPAGVPYWMMGPDGSTGADPAGSDTPKPTNKGIATVTITGGTIGISGRDNGLVFGSSRGDISAPTPKMDQYDRVAWVRGTVVNIGNSETPTDLTTPLIKGSVYGGGENGHNYQNANVNVYSGTIGIANKIPGSETPDPWWDFGDEDLNREYRGYRGNVYGAGSGSDTYTGADGKEYYNARAGMVGGSTVVNIAGGHIGRSVYGAGAMASVGNVTNARDTTDVRSGIPNAGTAKHSDPTNSFALSWPYKYEFAPSTGKATVNVTGGHIGTLDTDGGDVYGSARGVAGDRYLMAHYAYVKETEVNINYTSPYVLGDNDTEETIQNDFTTQCITGSVHGSGENGYVYGDTRVTLDEGLVGHSLYGAGKGKGTYTKSLNKIGGDGTYEAEIYSLLAGKVFGNTYVTMNGGHVGRNVYGGGNMGSVGKGNYAGGADDYFPSGYGETITGNLWDNVSDDSKAFLGSGKTTVNVISGTVGYIDADPTKSMKNELPYGNVFGGSAGEAAPNVADDPSDLYLYSPAFFSGYVNETDVTIGGYRCKTAYGDYKAGDCITAAQYAALGVNQANWELVGPVILASVYGGGQDGHVRRDTKVNVLSGEIGKPYDDTNISLLKTDNINDPQWLHRGNVYGGGSGITKYHFDLDGDGKTDKNDGSLSYNGKPFNEEDYSTSSGSVTRFTEVNVLGGIVHRNVYGGCSLGSVGAPKILETQGDLYKKDLDDTATLGKQSLNLVNIRGQIGTAVSSRSQYGGDVFGAGRGNPSLNVEEFGTSIWTRVNILNGATIFGNVFGGGDAGAVKKDAEVVIGD